MTPPSSPLPSPSAPPPRAPLLPWRDSAVVVVVAGAFFICVTMGIRQSFGLYLTPYTAADGFGISREAFSFAIALQNILWGIFSPIFGSLADRRGAPFAAAVGAAFYTLGVLVMAAAGSGGMLTLGQGFIGIGLAGAGFSVVLGAVGKAVPAQKRAMALGFATAAGSFGQFALVPIAQGAMSAWGVQESLVLSAAFAFAMLLCAPLLKLPAAARAAPVADKNTAVLATAFASPSYVLLFLGFFVCGFQLVFIATHLPAYLDEFGLAPSVAANALAMIGLCNIFGSFFCGWVGGRVLKKNALTVLYTMRSVVIILFLLAPKTPTTVILFGAGMGFLWLGTVPLTSSLITVLFGTRHLSMLYGFVFFSHQLGSFFGAWLGGVLYAATDSYDFVWYLCIGLGFAAAALHAPIKERLDRPFAERFSVT